MAKWRKTVDIKVVLNRTDIADGDKPPLIAEVLLGSGDGGLRMYATKLADMGGDDYDEDEANAVLSRLYDYADRERIWLGL